MMGKVAVAGVQRGRLVFWARSGASVATGSARSQFGTFVIASLAPATYDLGLASDAGQDAGENTFSRLMVSGSNVTVFASGNTWQADVQGADAEGHYPIGNSRVVTGGERIEGSNFDLTSEGGPVWLMF